jgi:hypothetical protein
MQKYSIYPLFSKGDKFGNCYWLFRALNLENGNMIEGTISGGESNIKSALRFLTVDETWEAVNNTCIINRSEEIPIRSFNQLAKSCKYAGCEPKEIAKFILDKIG